MLLYAQALAYIPTLWAVMHVKIDKFANKSAQKIWLSQTAETPDEGQGHSNRNQAAEVSDLHYSIKFLCLFSF